HERFALSDDAADRMDAELEHRAILRSSDVHTLQLVLGRDPALDELADLGVDLAHFLCDFAAQILIDLNDLQLDLGNLSLGLCHQCYKLRMLAIEPRRLPLQLREAVDLDQVLLEQFAYTLKLAVYQCNFCRFGLLLRGQAGNLFDKLLGLLTQLRLLAEPGGAAQF